jgi:beta-lactamase regulating signal transducer with metallopeptidase domain
MSGISINSLADGWLAAVLRASWQGGIAVLLVWAVCTIAPSIPPRIRCWLWRLAAAELILGLVWLSPISLPVLPPEPSMVVATSVIPQAVEQAPFVALPQATDPVNSEPARAVPNLTHRSRPIHWPAVLLLLWTFGIIVGLFRLAINYRRARRIRTSARPIGDNSIAETAKRLGRQMGIARVPTIAFGSSGAGPVLIGPLRPIILLPESWAGTTAAAMQEMAMAHELAHLLRRDLVWSWLNALAGVLFFFHPLAWLLCRESAGAADAACDVEALAATSCDRKSYSQLLLDLAARHAGLGTGAFGMLAMIETVGSLKKRLRDVANAKRTSRRALVIAGLLIAAVAIPSLVNWQLVRRASAAEPTTSARASTTQPASTSSLITGHVFAADGKPVSGATVVTSLWLPDHMDPLASTQTGPDGAYTLPAPVPAPPIDEGGGEFDLPRVFAYLPGVGESSGVSNPAGIVDLQFQPSVDWVLKFVDSDGEPVSGFRVFPEQLVFDDRGPAYQLFLLATIPHNDGLRWAATTDAHGECVIHGLSRYSKVIYWTSDDPRFAHQKYDGRIQFVANNFVSAAPIQLLPAVPVEGNVINPETGRPIGGVQLHALGGVHNGVLETPTQQESVATDAQGHFLFARLRPTAFVISMDLKTLPDEWTGPAQLVNLADRQPHTVNMVLVHGGLVAGKVRDAVTKKGIAGVNVHLWAGADLRNDTQTNQSVLTDVDGNYSFRTPTGTQHVCNLASVPDGYSTLGPDSKPFSFTPEVTEGKTTTVDFELLSTPAVVGTVFDPDGKLVAGATVLADDPDGYDDIPGRYQGRLDRTTTTTDANGRYRLFDVKGRLTVRARYRGMATEHPLITRDAVALIGNASSQQLDIHLSADAHFSLTVEVTDSAGSVIPGATVTLTSMIGLFPELSSAPMSVDNAGRVSFQSLLTDTYYSVSAAADGYSHASSSVKIAPPGNPPRTNLRIPLERKNASIWGTVVDQAGKPVPGIRVNVSSIGSSGTTTTDEQGRFVFSVADDAMDVHVSLRDYPQVSRVGYANYSGMKLVLPAPATEPSRSQ